MKKIYAILSVILCLLLLTACSAMPDGSYWYPATGDSYFSEVSSDNYDYDEVRENDFVSSAETNSSYFSLDRNTASYTLMRQQLTHNMKLAANSVRLEEYVNYFNYNYVRPQNGDALALSGGISDCPWNSDHKLFTIGVAAEEVSFENPKQNNVVFLIDTSGSMYGEDRLGLIQQAFTMLLDCLNDEDYVYIVTYAGDMRVALDGARGYEKSKIANVLQDLTAEGSTNGSGGLKKAYDVAEVHKIDGGNNRIILATDGDFNVGISNKNQLKDYVFGMRESGIYLSVLGVGMFNTRDSIMETLAENGNGNYAYLDSVTEARKVLVQELGGTFNVVAKDAKAGVIFNSDVVESYRLIGYENKMMSEEEFDDQKKDAGEIGSGHTVTAVYEIQLKEGAAGDVATVEVRYKNPDNDESKSVSKTYTTQDIVEGEDVVFIGCVVEFGLVLRQSQYAQEADLANVAERLNTLQSVVGENADEFRKEFLELVEKAQQIYGSLTAD